MSQLVDIFSDLLFAYHLDVFLTYILRHPKRVWATLRGNVFLGAFANGKDPSQLKEDKKKKKKKKKNQKIRK